MSSQRGSAVAIVLILLAAGGLMGAGLMLQSQLNTKVTTAKTSRVRSVNIADWAAQLAYKHVATSQEAVETELSFLNRLTTTLYSSGPDDREAWVAKKTYEGLLDAGGAVAGDEEGREGEAIQAWLAEGVGDRGDGWALNKTYQKDQKVTNEGATFECKATHTSSKYTEPGVDYNAVDQINPDWEPWWEPVAPARTVVQIPVRKKIKRGGD